MRKYISILLFFGFIIVFHACEQENTKEINPAAEGFNLEGSDEKAIQIADAVMKASGGRAVWDSTQFLQWNFFGRRLHKWNKKTGDIIIDIPRDSLNIVMNLITMSGSVISKGENISDEMALNAYMQRGKEMWINDSYWVFLPFKLKDSGVTLKYLGESQTSKGEAAEKLELTFEGVGVTPENKYHIYVDQKSNLVSQWDFYSNFADEEPRFSNPWEDYQDYNGIQLSSSRGGERKMTDLAVGNDIEMK